ncbi:hypothetical protein GIB67_013537, partial [Kingdonia uniflora]
MAKEKSFIARNVIPDNSICGAFDGKTKLEGEITSREKVNYCQYMVHALLLILKQFDQEQKHEKALEAKIQGVSPSDICLQKLDCYSDERVY